MYLIITLTDRYNNSEPQTNILSVNYSDDLVKKIREANTKEQKEHSEDYTDESILKRIERDTGGEFIDTASINLLF